MYRLCRPVRDLEAQGVERRQVEAGEEALERGGVAGRDAVLDGGVKTIPFPLEDHVTARVVVEPRLEGRLRESRAVAEVTVSEALGGAQLDGARVGELTDGLEQSIPGPAGGR